MFETSDDLDFRLEEFNQDLTRVFRQDKESQSEVSNKPWYQFRKWFLDFYDKNVEKLFRLQLSRKKTRVIRKFFQIIFLLHLF